MENTFRYTFNLFNEFTDEGICQSINKINTCEKTPVVVCVGSDLVLGDSLGPLIGTFLKKKGCNAFVYGSLNYPITAKEIEYIKKHLKNTHPNSFVITIDAALGNEEDIGLIRVINKGIKPGLGVDKNLSEIGDASIIGIVAKKTKDNYDLYNLTRLNLIYKMAEKISNGINKYLFLYDLKQKTV